MERHKQKYMKPKHLISFLDTIKYLSEKDGYTLR